jgi:hypothetical protein
VDRKDDATITQTTTWAYETCAKLATTSFKWATCYMRDKSLLAEFGMEPPPPA